jgi:hypothetical protein
MFFSKRMLPAQDFIARYHYRITRIQRRLRSTSIPFPKWIKVEKKFCKIYRKLFSSLCALTSVCQMRAGTYADFDTRDVLRANQESVHLSAYYAKSIKYLPSPLHSYERGTFPASSVCSSDDASLRYSYIFSHQSTTLAAGASTFRAKSMELLRAIDERARVASK